MKISQSSTLLALFISFILCNALNASEITVKVTDTENNPVSNLIVYLLPLDGQSLEQSKTATLVINQADKKFQPYISVIQKGLGLTFNNDDDITHQIYSSSANNRFSFRIKSGSQMSIEPLKNTGKVLMGCNIHDWMGGYLLVLDTPLYSKTNEKGITKLNVHEKGNYQLSVWHPQLMEEDQTVTTKININNSNIFEVQLSNKMAEIPRQENPENTDFTEDY